MVPVRSDPAGKSPWWKGPAGYIVGLTVLAAIVVAIVLVATSGGGSKATKTTDSVAVTTGPDTRAPRTDVATTVRRTTTTQRTTPRTTSPSTTEADTSPDFTLPALTDPPTTVAATTTAPTTAAPTTAAPDTTPATTPATAAPGGPLPIGGQATVTDDSDSVQVTVLALADNAAAPQYLPPDPGDKLVSVQIRLVNSGAQPVDVSPETGATLIDGSNQQFTSSFTSSGAGPALSTVRILPGDVRSGWLTWEVPKASVPTKLQWKLNFGDNGAQWDLTQPAQAPIAAPAVIAPATAFNTPATLHGNDGVAMTVAAMRVVDNAKSQLPVQDAGTRLVAVQFTFTNAGQNSHTDYPDFAVDMIDADGQQYTASIFGTTAGPGFDGEIDLSPGDSRTGFLAFEVPKNAQVVKVQVRLDSGSADEVAEIALG
jgi:hypothetical protein